ncbi:MAG TPA: N-methyl-D-aspartate receptor NMDAR2C subunit [Patescibacteria group bacterium]|nr:N-methyl-D-aspartate receptor NMDAR2C subunit [Patescibacteria group bacterium]
MPLTESDHQAKWTDLWSSVGAKGDPIPPYLDLRDRYAESHRNYHTWKHIADGLAEFEAVAHLAESPDAIRMAYYFHDAIYDTQVPDSQNVDQSAELAVAVMEQAQLPQPFVRKVSDLVIVTKHTVPPVGIHAQLMVDIDFSIIGKPPVEFEEYEIGIRREHAWVDEQTFRNTRAGILERFLQRPQVFNNTYFLCRYEVQARRNLQGSIAKLKS